MGKDGNSSGGLPAWIAKVLIFVAPVLALAAIALHLLRSDDEAASGKAAAAQISPAAPSERGTGTANPPAGDAAAFADRPARIGGGQLSPAPSEDFAPEPVVSPPASAPRGGPIVWVRTGEEVEILDAPGGERVARQGDETEFGSPSVFFVRRERGRWAGVSTPEVPNGELGWIRADPQELRAGFVDHSIVVDLSERSAELFDGKERIRSWAVTTGAPGSETPAGTFAVTDTFRGGLDPVYGCCAVALSATQPDLPSGWMGGNRIAFHGTGGPLGVAASLGCIRSADEDVMALLKAVPLGTPVSIVE